MFIITIKEHELFERAATITDIILGKQKSINTMYGTKTYVGVTDLIVRKMSDDLCTFTERTFEL